MGAPAGLKLNKQLTEFLGHFFLYHIYLWKSKFYMLEIKFLKFFLFPKYMRDLLKRLCMCTDSDYAGYLGILQPVLGSVLWSASLLGVLGFTAQLCFFRDVLSMMTLHIYCFYVYAAR